MLRHKGIPVKTNVASSYNDQTSVQPDFARIAPGAGAAQNKQQKLHKMQNSIGWNSKV